MNPTERRALVVAVGLVSAYSLLRVLLSPGVLVYDEPPYLISAQDLCGSHFGAQWLHEMKWAAGPLYPLLHCALSPLTSFAPVAVRLVSLSLLAITALLVVMAVRRARPAVDPLSATALIAIPFCWVSAGLALTENPALPFLVGSIICVQLVLSRPTVSAQLGYAFVGGLLLAVATMGRQPLIACAVPFSALLWVERRLAAAAVFFCAAATLPIGLFLIWGGLVPPAVAHLATGVAPLHALLGFGYASIALLFINPRMLWVRWAWIAAGVAGAVLTAANVGTYSPALSLARRLLPPAFEVIYPRVAFGALTSLAVAFAAAVGVELWRQRHDRFKLAVSAAALLLLLANAKVTHQFSSRYLVPVLPLMVLAFVPDRVSLGAAVRLVVGAAIGFASLETYYQLGSP